MTWWNNETYDVADVIKSVRASGPWRKTNGTIIDKPGYYRDVNLTIKPVPSAYGRCYSMYFHTTLKSSHEYYGVTVNTDIFPEITFYLHEKHNEIGLLWSYWPISPVTFSVKAKDQLIVTVQKDTHTPTSTYSTFACTNDYNHSYPKCVTERIRKAYIDMFTKHNKTGELI